MNPPSDNQPLPALSSNSNASETKDNLYLFESSDSQECDNCGSEKNLLLDDFELSDKLMKAMRLNRFVRRRPKSLLDKDTDDLKSKFRKLRSELGDTVAAEEELLYKLNTETNTKLCKCAVGVAGLGAAIATIAVTIF